MQEYYFLLSLGVLWTIFAVVQDLRTTEVANWLNFSLIAFALSYRAFYAITMKDIHFFFLGVLGVAFFVLIAFALYYARAFAGGDAKLLMGFGALLPYYSYLSIPVIGFIFLLVLFLLGAIYSIAYSAIMIIPKNKKKFVKEFRVYMYTYRYTTIISLLLFTISLIASFFIIEFLALLLISTIPLVYAYTKSLDACMLVKTPPQKLMEGDWLPHDIHVGKYTIKKTVHGLTARDIALLRKAKKTIAVKQGIPFTPAFLLALLVMGYVVVISPILLRDLQTLLP